MELGTFEKRIVFSWSSIEELRNTEFPYEDAGIYGKEGATSVNHKSRKTHIRHLPIGHAIYKDILSDTRLSYPEYRISQMDILLYEVGEFFMKHKDYSKYAPQRELSVITLLDRSDDLEGGDLLIYHQRADKIHRGKSIPKLNIGESIIFNSSTYHEVTKVTRGWRKSSITWLYKDS